LALVAALGVAACGPGEPDRAEPGSTEWAPRADAAVAHVGSFLFAYGGLPAGPEDASPAHQVRPLGDAALLNTVNDELRVLPDPPLGSLGAPAEAVGMPGAVMVLGVGCDVPGDEEEGPEGCEPGTYDAAVYSVDDDAWREVELPEAVRNLERAWPEALGTTTDGRPVFLLDHRTSRQIWVYDPARDDWTKVADPGVGLVDACLAGDTLVVAAGRTVRTTDLAAADGGWATSPETPGRVRDQAACGYHEVLLHDAGQSPVVLSVEDGATAGDWQRPAAPAPDGVFLDVLWTGHYFLFVEYLGTGVAGYHPGLDLWIDPPVTLAEPVSDPLWAGDRVVGWSVDRLSTRPVH
jgi:hypothetical protein